MSKKLIWALVLIALSALVLIFNRQDVDVNLLFMKAEAMASIVFLAFIAVGVAIGVLLK